MTTAHDHSHMHIPFRPMERSFRVIGFLHGSIYTSSRLCQINMGRKPVFLRRQNKLQSYQ
jgi:hypothetical protein